MKFNVLETGASTRTLEIEVPVERIKEEMEEHYAKLARRAKLPGFRPGKVPRPILEKNFGPQVEQEVLEHLVPDVTFEALQESKLDVVGRPRIEGLQFSPNSAMQFKAMVEIKPAFELSEQLTGLKVQIPSSQVTDEQVDRQLKMLAENQAVVGEPVERAAAKGDQVSIDFAGTVDGKPFEGGKAQGFRLEIGSNSTIPGFEDALLGATPGSKVVAPVQFPADYHAKELAGKKAEFTIHLKEVREKKLPEINDEFAKTAGDFPSLDALKLRIRESLEGRAKAERHARIVEQISEQVCKAHTFEPPQAMVEGELAYLADREKQSLQRQGLQLAEDEDKLKKELRPLAENRARLSLILGKLAQRENITVSEEEYRAEMGKVAPSLGMGAPEAIRWAAENGRETGFKHKLLEDKAMEWLISKAAIEEK